MRFAILERMATTVRVAESTRARAAAIAAKTGATIGDVVEQALDAYETAEFWRRTRQALREAPRDPDEAAWERSVRDGIDRE
jgi:predicted transcriptional regulator